MGYAERARRANEELGMHYYTVRRWTAFSEPDATNLSKSQRDARESERKDRDRHLERAAGIMERKLLDICPRNEPRVKAGRVKRWPQLMFEVTLLATSEDHARVLAMYWIKRGMSAKVPTGRLKPVSIGRRRSPITRPERVTLSPPWGKWEVEKVRGRRWLPRTEPVA